MSGFFTHASLQFALSVAVPTAFSSRLIIHSAQNKAGRAFLDSAAISQTDRAKIAHRNAERLLRL
jgi:predicted TIM-barrel fold metal-dependent hydrolase